MKLLEVTAPLAAATGFALEPTGQRLGIRVQLAGVLPGRVFRFNGSVGQVLANRDAGKPGTLCNLPDR